MYINSFYILTPKSDEKKIEETTFKYCNSFFEINYKSKDEINVYITTLKEFDILESKMISILLYKNSYIVLTQLYTEVEIVKKILKYRFDINSYIYYLDNEKYVELIKKYKINSVYVIEEEKIVNIKINENEEVNKYLNVLYSTVFTIKSRNMPYVLNMPKFGLFHTGHQNKNDIINIIEELDIVNV